MKQEQTEVVWKGAPELRALLVPVGEVFLDPENVRQHPDENLAHIRTSYEAYGQQKPVVVSKAGKVLAGNGQLQAVQALKWTHIAAVRFTGSESLEAAFAIADNRSGETSKWDYSALAAQLKAMDDDVRPLTLFDGADLQNLLAADWTPPAEETMVSFSTDPSKHNVSFTREEWADIKPHLRGDVPEHEAIHAIILRATKA